MEFRIADTFSDSLARLTGDEQKAVRTTALDLQIDPPAPSLSFHKLDKVRDKWFWSVRVNADIRLGRDLEPAEKKERRCRFVEPCRRLLA